MTGLVREWLMGVTGAAILTALAEGMMPEGAVKQVGKLACGLVLLLAVLSPMRPDRGQSRQAWHPDSTAIQHQARLLREEAEENLRTVIEGEMGAYSMDKAAQMGLNCRIEVGCAAEENGVFLPRQVVVTGTLSELERTALSKTLTADLGLSPERILFREEEGP